MRNNHIHLLLHGRRRLMRLSLLHTHPWIDSSSSGATSLEPASHLSARYSLWKRQQTSHLSSRWMHAMLTYCFSLSPIVSDTFPRRFNCRTSPFNTCVKTRFSSCNVRRAAKLSRLFVRCTDALRKGSAIMISPFVSSIKPVQTSNNPNIRRNFGRPTINDHFRDQCGDVRFSCHGKSTCQILINNDLFTDPCGLKIPKHFEIHYRCLDRGQESLYCSLSESSVFFSPDQLCPALFVNCSKLKDVQCIEKVQDEFACSCPPTICQYSERILRVLPLTMNIFLQRRIV